MSDEILHNFPSFNEEVFSTLKKYPKVSKKQLRMENKVKRLFDMVDGEMPLRQEVITKIAPVIPKKNYGGNLISALKNIWNITFSFHHDTN
jgi:hypothetical protein